MCTQFGQFRTGSNISFQYRYVKYQTLEDNVNVCYEARPYRQFFLANPEDYAGDIQSQTKFVAGSSMDSELKYDSEVLWQMSDAVNIVNDNIFKADGTFIYKDLEPIELKEDDCSLNIVLGPFYHSASYACDRLAKIYHVTAVLNL